MKWSGAKVRAGRHKQAEMAKKVAKKTATKKAAAKKTATKKATAPGDARKKSVPEVEAVVRERREAALGRYEEALGKLHKQDWKGASQSLTKLIADFSKVAEVLDRARAKLAICERELRPGGDKPKSSDEHYELAILQLNDGSFEDAAKLLEKALELDADSDKAHYALAAALSLNEKGAEAIGHLRRSIELNPDNRVYAGNDSDLALLREEPEFFDLVGRGAGPVG